MNTFHQIHDRARFERFQRAARACSVEVCERMLANRTPAGLAVSSLVRESGGRRTLASGRKVELRRA